MVLMNGEDGRAAQRHVRDERRPDARALGGPKQDLLDDVGTRVGIDPDLHDHQRQRIARGPAGAGFQLAPTRFELVFQPLFQP